MMDNQATLKAQAERSWSYMWPTTKTLERKKDENYNGQI
jgi:hypothetical protein